MPSFIPLFISWPVFGLFPHFWLLWIVLLWTFIYKFLHGRMFSFPLVMCRGVELPSHVVILYLTFGGRDRLFSTAATPFCIPVSTVWEISLHNILTNTCHCLFFGSSHSSEWEVLSPCVDLTCISLMQPWHLTPNLPGQGAGNSQVWGHFLPDGWAGHVLVSPCRGWVAH